MLITAQLFEVLCELLLKQKRNLTMVMVFNKGEHMATKYTARQLKAGGHLMTINGLGIQFKQGKEAYD